MSGEVAMKDLSIDVAVCGSLYTDVAPALDRRYGMCRMTSREALSA